MIVVLLPFASNVTFWIDSTLLELTELCKQKYKSEGYNAI
jgi:hypothetical protein